jgi:hypothetical protein
LNLIDRAGVANAQLLSLVDNWGLVKGVDVAISGGVGQETVINHGQIVGDVVLGDGNDTFVAGKGGTLTGNLFLGGGADLVRVENGSGATDIADFVTAGSTHDKIDISSFFANFNDLIAHSQQISNDVVITLDHHNDQVILQGVQLGALNAGDFLSV